MLTRAEKELDKWKSRRVDTVSLSVNYYSIVRVEFDVCSGGCGSSLGSRRAGWEGG